jgi:hypothetical protein
LTLYLPAGTGYNVTFARLYPISNKNVKRENCIKSVKNNKFALGFYIFFNSSVVFAQYYAILLFYNRKHILTIEDEALNTNMKILM